MEHAIRWKIKVELENKDPGLYQRFKDRLDSIITTYQGNWAQMIKELDTLKQAVDAGHPVDPRLTSLQAPFYEWIKQCIIQSPQADLANMVAEEHTPYNSSDANDASENDDAIITETKIICGYIKEVISVANFWEKDDEISALSGKIASRLRLGPLRNLIPEKNELTAQIISICKSNYTELVRRRDDLA